MEITKFILSILELSTYILFTYFILHTRITIKLQKGILAIIIYTLSYIIIKMLPFEFASILELLLHLIIYLYLVNGTVFYKIKMFIIAWLIAGFIDILVFTSLNLIYNTQRTSLTECLSILCINIMWIILSPQTKKYVVNKSVAEIPRTIYFNILITCFSCSMVLMVLILFKDSLNTPIKVSIITITLITLSLTIVTVYQFLRSDNLKYFYLDRNKVLEQDLKLQKEYFSSMYQQYENVRSISHDINAHMFCIKNLLEEQKYTILQDYLSELTQKGNINDANYHCSDTYISAILYNLLPRIKAKNIDFKFTYLLVKEMSLTPTEKSSLFYNLLTNCIEACEKVNDKRKIELIIESTLSNVLITVKNTVEDDSCLNNFLAKQTSKNDTIFHGIGVSNINRIVTSYDGTINATVIEDCFQITILLYNSLK